MRFEIRGIEVGIFLGTTEEERSEKQIILASVFFDFETSAAENSDDLSDTIDYSEVYRFVKDFFGDDKIFLLEKAYRSLFDGLKKEFPDLNGLSLELEKLPFLDAKVKIKLNYSMP